MTNPDPAYCLDCGVELEPVRPGKHQHPEPDCRQPEDDVTDPEQLQERRLDPVL